ncbi:glycerophosphodiester phosphodiesterase [Actinomyces faecalis]|uniref:glycerophosphodiester phosphodiesterase n=1 Tax=Actinomyces faecalis TaxID=2722820 RepID=UPI0015520279|nr:glycerophosphodiester phosphodiesterase [Actinomyces faecalis]
MTSDQTPWQSPSAGTGEEENREPSQQEPQSSPRPQPRFGTYGTVPAGRPVQPEPGQPGYTYGQVQDAAATGQQWYGGSGNPYGAPGTSGPGGFLLAPKPGIVPLRPLSIGEIITGAFESLRANPRAMFVPALVVMSVLGVLSALLTFLSSRQLDSLLSLSASDLDSLAADGSEAAAGLSPVFTLGSVAGSVVTAVMMSLAGTVLTGLLIVVVSRSVLGRLATPGEVWQRTRSRVWALICQSLLTSFIVYGVLAVGSTVTILAAFGMFGSAGASRSTGTTVLAVLAIVIMTLATLAATVFLWVRVSMAPAVLVLENVGVITAISRSWELTRQGFWRVLGVLALAAIIANVALSVVSGVVGTLTTVLGTVLGAFALLTALSALLGALLSAVVMPFSAAVTALTYIDLRMRREGLDVELRQAAAA